MTTQHLQQMDESTAVSFIKEVHDRAEGNIPSPVLETLLNANFEDLPHKEFTSGMTRTYTVKGHSKAKGTDWQVKVPLSWKALEGDRPNIIQKFVNDYGDGDCMIVLMVHDVDILDSEVAELLSDENLVKVIFNEAGEVIEYEKMIIDNFPGGMIEIEQIVERLDITAKVRMQQYFAFRDSKMYILQGAIGSVHSADNYDMVREMGKYAPLFRLVANSIIINDQYIQ